MPLPAVCFCRFQHCFDPLVDQMACFAQVSFQSRDRPAVVCVAIRTSFLQPSPGCAFAAKWLQQKRHSVPSQLVRVDVSNKPASHLCLHLFVNCNRGPFNRYFCSNSIFSLLFAHLRRTFGLVPIRLKTRARLLLCCVCEIVSVNAMFFLFVIVFALC